MIFDITRLTDVAGQDFNSRKCRVRSPHITARDSIEIGNYIVKKDKIIAELESKNAKMLECLCDISDACIGQLNMNYSLDSEGIGQSIYEATGMTNPELNAALKEQVKL